MSKGTGVLVNVRTSKTNPTGRKPRPRAQEQGRQRQDVLSGEAGPAELRGDHLDSVYDDDVSAPVQPSKTRDRLVVLSIVLVSAAVYGVLRFQFGVAFGAALAAAAAIGSFAMLIHLHQRKSAEIQRLQDTIEQLQDSVGAGTQPSLSGRVHTPSNEKAKEAVYEELSGELPSFGRRQNARGVSETYASVARAHEAAISENNVEAARDVAAQFNAAFSDQAGPASRALKGNDRDCGSAQVSRQPELNAPDMFPAAAEQDSGRAPVSTIDEELLRVQKKIKALTEQVDGRQPPETEQSSFDTDMPASKPQQSQQPNLDTGLGSVDQGADNAFDFDIEASIGALRSASKNMRQDTTPPAEKKASGPAAVANDRPSSAPPLSDFTGFDIPSSAQRIASSKPQSGEAAGGREPGLSSAKPAAVETKIAASRVAGAADSRAGQSLPKENDFDFPGFASGVQADRDDPFMKQIDSALRRGAVDVLLSPIVDLDTHGVNLYNVEVRLKSEIGEPLEQVESHLRLTQSPLAPVLDAARLARSVALARRLDARGRGGVLLSGVNGLSLTNAPFLDAFAEFYDDCPSLAELLAPTITHAEIERLPEAAWQALRDMHAFGFSFAIDELDHADVDFDKLTSYGFKYVKLDSAQFLSGMPSRERFLTAEEVCQKMKKAGLTIVAGNITDERMRSDVVALGIQNGLGSLFGSPRVKSVEPYSVQRRQTSAA